MKETEQWAAPFEGNPLLQSYFDGLPKNVQEQLVQSGVRVEGIRELRELTERLQTGKD